MSKQYIAGTLNGTGADLVVCCGFRPDKVRLVTLETTDEAIIEWSKLDRSAEALAGLGMDDDGALTPITAAAGIAQFKGGDILSAASTVYLVRDPSPDKRAAGTLGRVTMWTSQTPASFTGKFNVGVNTTYVGEGSRVVVYDRASNNRYNGVVTALTNDGDADDEVTIYDLDTHKAVPSGEVVFLGGMYDYVGAASGTRLPDGFFIDSTCPANVNGSMLRFEASCFDM